MKKTNGKSFGIFSHFPQGIGTLFFVQIFATLSYSVLYSTLVLYMTKSLGFSKTEANTITGFFLAFNYGLHLFGGFIGGRFMSNRLLFAIGMVLTVVACVLLSIPSLTFFYIGLAVFLTGSGLNVTCLNCMVTQCFEPNDPARENAFFWIYSGMNIGFFAGFSISGFFEQTGNYHILFMLSGLGNLVALFMVMSHWSVLRDRNTKFSELTVQKRRRAQKIGLSIVSAMLPLILILLHYSSIANKFVLMTGCLMVCVLLGLAYQQPTQAHRNKMFAFVMLMLGSSVFWTLYQIAPMGLTLFIKHNVDAHLFGVAISPQWIQNVNTIVIVLGGPLLSTLYLRLRKNGYDINIPFQFAMALMLIGAAFLLLPMGIAGANTKGLTHINWVIGCYFLQSMGELLLSPVGYAMIGRLAPPNLQGIMMGSWMMVTGVSATISNRLSNMMVTESSDLAISNANYSEVFSMLGKAALIAGVVLLLLGPFLKRLIDGPSNKKTEPVVPDRVEPEVAA